MDQLIDRQVAHRVAGEAIEDGTAVPSGESQNASIPVRSLLRPLGKRRFWKWLGLNLKGLRVFIVQVGAIIGVILLGSSVWHEMNRTTVEIEPIGVPKSLADEGFSPAVIARRISDEIRVIERSSKTTMSKRDLSISGDRLDIVLPGANLSVGTIASYLRGILGDNVDRVSGELTETNGQLQLQLRVSGRGPLESSKTVSRLTLNEALKAGAEQIVRATEPYVLASALYEKEPDRAVAEVKRIIAEYPVSDENVARAYNLWGLILAHKNEYAGAIEKYREALTLKPRAAFVHSNVGNALQATGDLEGAIQSHWIAITVDPSYGAAYNNLGNALVSKGEVGEAILRYRQALEIDPKLTFAYLGIGNALRIKKDTDGAVASYRMALDADPEFAEAYVGIGNVLYDKHDLDGAIDNYEKALEIDATVDNGLVNLGTALGAKGDLEASIEISKQAIEIDPNSSEAHFNVARALYSLNAGIETRQSNLLSACAYLNKGHALAPKDKAYARLAGRIDAKMSGLGGSCKLD
jgi:tetratricopeptide (TPR) repeat protein